MKNKFEGMLVAQCAPTLAALKAGSLFRYPLTPRESLETVLAGWNERLREKGVRIRLVRKRTASALIYVYRPAKLAALLSDREIRDFLGSLGYGEHSDPEGCVERLCRRIGSQPCFPHEAGVFLGYPLRDVQGFIRHRGKNWSLCGCWKVYEERQRAEKLFAQYEKCRNIYKARFREGADILKLTVAA